MNKFGWISIGFALFLGCIILLANSGSEFIWWIARFPMADKVGHFLLFGSLAFLLNMALNCRRYTLLDKEVLLGSLIVLCVVTLEELSQLFIPARTFDITDFMYDGVGIFVGGYLAVIVLLVQKRYFLKLT